MKIVVFVTVLGLVGLGYRLMPKEVLSSSAQSRLEAEGLVLQLSDWTTSRWETALVKEHSVVFFSLAKGNDFIEGTIVNDLQSGEYGSFLEQKLFDLNNRFAAKATPYAGAVTKKNECPVEFVPRPETFDVEGGSSTWVQTWATSRRQLGVCSEDEKSLRVGIVSIYCRKQKRAFYIQGFSREEKSQMLNAIKAAHCR